VRNLESGYELVMEDNQEIGAYMFRRTVPAVHMAPEDVRWMVGQFAQHECIGLHNYVKAITDSSDHMPAVKVAKYGNQICVVGKL
jgi:hypothetical protein